MRKKSSVFITAALLLALLGGGVMAQDEAQGEFDKLVQDLNRQQRAMPMPQFIDMAEKGLLDFIKKYPASAATGTAHITLGQLYNSLGRNDDAIRHLREFFSGEYEKKEAEVGAARFILGSCYLAMEKFDEAEKELKQLTAAGSTVDGQTRRQATRVLEQIDILRKLTIGSPAIDFSMQDTEGRMLKLADYRGKVVLVDFWATWCAPCRQEMPNVKKVYSHYHKKGFDIIGVSFDNSRDKLDGYVKENGIEWKQIYDGKGWQTEIGRSYAINSIPSTFLLDREGKIRYKNLRGEELEKSVKKLLAE
ncbi:MAG: redoxin domain-containing protein [Candidatus Krumholzibacteriota bacterium]|nr:redoxin domain-containing protein [Candidatus Krumholzibacteriota bacterium]